jgi:hypothetical protein
MRYPGFVGPTARNWSISVDAEETINWYAEGNDATPKANPVFKPTPGLEPYVRLGAAPVRALFYQDGRCFAVAGNRFYEVFASQNATQRGTVAQDANPATISSNGSAGHQLFITSGGLGYIYDLVADTLTQITDDGFPTNVLAGAYLDSYFLALETNTIRVYFSALLDGTSWSGLDFLAVSQYSDNIVAMAVNSRDLWLQGSQHTQVWRNTGEANNPFQPIDGAYVESGAAAPFALTQIDNSLMWIASDIRGGRMVMRAEGYNGRRVSTHAIESYLNALPHVNDAIGWAYQEDGHTFYMLYLPTARHFVVYDVATQQWHKRAIWDSTLCRWFPDLGRCHAYAFEGIHLVGDRQSGMVYRMSLPIFNSLTGTWRFADYNYLAGAL